MDELFNMNINGQRVSLGIVHDGNASWPVGITVMYGSNSHFSSHTTGTIWRGASASEWFHIVYSIYGSADTKHRVWVNGCECGLYNNGGSHGGTAGWHIGSNSSSGEYWNGNIDNVRFFNRSLRSYEAWDLYEEYQVKTEVVKQNLKVWYDFSDTACYPGTGTTVYNIAPGVSGFDGTIQGASWGGIGQTKYFDFERDNSYDKIITSTAITPTFNNKELTMEAWVLHESIISNELHAIISCQNDAGANEGASICTDGRSNTHGGGTQPVYHYQLGQNYSGGTRWTTDGNYGNTGSNTAYPQLRWDHIVATFDGYRKMIYENGVCKGFEGDWPLSNNESIRYAGGSTWTIGAQPENGTSYTRFYDGRIAIVRIYDAALSQTQVRHNYNIERSRFSEPESINWVTGGTWSWSNGSASSITNKEVLFDFNPSNGSPSAPAGNPGQVRYTFTSPLVGGNGGYSSVRLYCNTHDDSFAYRRVQYNGAGGTFTITTGSNTTAWYDITSNLGGQFNWVEWGNYGGSDPNRSPSGLLAIEVDGTILIEL